MDADAYEQLSPQDEITIGQFFRMTMDHTGEGLSAGSERKREFLQAVQVDKQEVTAADFLTRQQLYTLIMTVIRQTPDLSDRCFPIDQTIEEGSDTDFFQTLFQGRLLDDVEGYSETVLAMQMAEAKKMSVLTQTYADGRIQRIFVWDSREDSPWRFAEMICDFEEVYSPFREDLLAACEIGLVEPVWDQATKYAFSLCPLKHVTKQEAERVLEKVFTPEERLPLDCIAVNYAENDEFDFPDSTSPMALIRIPSLPVLLAAHSLQEQMGEEDMVFFTFGLNGVSFCLWYQFEKYGMLALPLQFCAGEPVCVEVHAQSDYVLQTRLKMLSFLIPPSERQPFLEWALNCMRGQAQLAEQEFGSVTVNIICFEEPVYSVYVI